MKSLFADRWEKILVILLAIYALPVMYYILSGTLGSHGATDFHQFWYAGHFILEGRDPYQAYFAGDSLPVRQPGLEDMPGQTPTMLLVLSLFSFLPWMAAKLAWLILNLLFVFLSVWLVLYRLPFPDVSLDRVKPILVFLIFFDLSPTRIAIENGQTTLFVFVLMLGAVLLADRFWLFAGLLLGLVLSKYSVSLPVVLFFLYHRKYRLLSVAILVQILGFAGLSLISGNSMPFIIVEYINMFLLLMDQSGVHLATLIPGTSFDIFFAGMMTIVIAILLYLWLVRRKPSHFVDAKILDFHLLTILFIWTLLVAYHRLYDALLLLVLIVLAFKSIQRGDVWHLSPPMLTSLIGIWGAGLALFIIPARIVDRFLPGAYGPLSNEVPAIILLILLITMMALLHRFLYPLISAAN